MLGIFWGLAGATMIGVSDCVARVTAQRVSLTLLFAAVMGLSTAALTGWLLVTGGWPHWDEYAWAMSALSGALNLVALGFLYTALARGPVAVASPAASSFSVLLVGLNALAGAPFVWEQGIAIALVFFGVTMLSQRGRGAGVDDYDAAHLRLTALIGLAAAASVAVRMFSAQEAASVLGSFPALYLNRVFALITVVFLVVIESLRHKPRRWPDARTGWLVLIQAVLETAALASFLIGSEGSGRVGASIGFAAFAPVTALTAWVWLGEAISLRRLIWMSVIVCGIVIAVMYAPG